MSTLKTITLGCKVNQYETEYIRQGFERLGYRNAARGEPVDLCIVNSCTVTAESEAKSRKTIRRLAQAHPEAEIIVMGCYASRAAEEVASLPGVVEVIADKRQLPDLLERRGLVDVPTGISRFDSRRRAYVKVQDGCRMACSYCIVPHVRPALSSRPASEALDEIRRLTDHGHREIVLTGIHLGDYGASNDHSSPHPNPPPDGEGTGNLAGLVRRIAELPGNFRLRLSSIEAAEVTPELIEAMAEYSDRICPHLHIPLQSGSDEVLRRMNRRWPMRQFFETCERVRAALDRPALTTDVIVGFPGETEEDFEATCRVVEEVGFAGLHVFRFSPRQGTPAAAMPGQVMGRTAQRRAADLARLGKKLRNHFLEGLLGGDLRALVEMPAPGYPGWMLGTCDRHATVALPGSREMIGQFVRVRAERVENGWIFGPLSRPTFGRCPERVRVRAASGQTV